jgi:predicted enzyme related to lactoylglutathione lyase
MSNPVVWFEVMGQHPDKLRAFYGELLGWKFDADNPMDYGLVAAGAGGIAGGIGKAPAGRRGWTTFYTKVPNLEAALLKAGDLGSQLVMPIQELPDTRIAVVTDPEGNLVGLCADPKPRG